MKRVGSHSYIQLLLIHWWMLYLSSPSLYTKLVNFVHLIKLLIFSWLNLSLSLSLSLPSLLSLDVFLFVHFLILLCSWVSNGVVGSPAFAAYDQGMYVVTFDLKLSEVAVIHYDWRSGYFLFYRIWCFPWELTWFGF